ncbi:DUF6531 domain-containing protein [Microlunatus speluncae]|uniref:DUF6531 domain-containing protein n=1 Tax=Microlunatus speluncae TaxID=2594267 RepID=UPI001375A70A|nr:DUF6531 domain-containing protein [Microlunatus speluncae]
MVDISNLGAIDEDVPFDVDTADDLITAFNGAAKDIDGQSSERSQLVTTALSDFEGNFSDLFKGNASVASADASELADRLREVATGAGLLKTEADKEQQRRQKARQWKKEQDDRNVFQEFGDWAFGGDDPPVGPPAEEPSIPVSAAQNGTRQTPPPGGAGGGGGTSSARPSELRAFATGSEGLNGKLTTRPATLRSHLTQFASKCKWGRLDADGVLTGFDKWLTANGEDVRWATTVANAFKAAGGEGNISRVSNSALAAALQAQGISATRQDLTIDPPQAYGHPPTTGYADDPVNTATGNFVETEVDLSFAGAAGRLDFARTYNAVDDRGGVFGPGWSSVLELRLDLADDGAALVLADGRRVLFPRLGDGWDRAPGESLWLARAESAAGATLEVTDNDGGRWTFTTGGLWLSLTRGPGTAITAERDADGRLVRLAHERGRWISVGWSGGRVEDVRSSDGRTVIFAYDEAGRLTSAAGPGGTRTYRWNDAGLISAVVDPDGVIEVENCYDDRRRVASQLSAFGRRTRYVYLAGRTTVVSDLDGERSNTWIADQRGRLIGVVDSDGQRQSMSYDGFGDLVSVTERDGSVTSHGYDDRGRLVRTLTPSGADLTYGYDDADRVTTVVTESGAATEYGYAGANRNPSVIIDPEGGRTELDWDDSLLRRVVDPTGVQVRFGYDEFGDLISVTNAADNVARLERDATGRVTAAITPSGARTSFHFDAAGRLVSRREPNGAIWRQEHSAAGRLTAVIDPLGGRTAIEYGPHGEATKSIDPLDRAATRIFDDLGNIAEAELPDGTSWRFVHDALSRLRETVDPTGGVWRREYDATGELVAYTDPSGAQLTLDADPAGATATVTEADNATGLRFDPLGRPVAAEPADGSTELISYDRCGRPVELVDGEGGLTVLRRDGAGRVIERVLPSGAATRLEYDECGRPAAVIDPLGARTTLEYDADGRVARRRLPTGEVAWSDYDESGRLLARFEPGRGLARFGYDLMGRVVRATDSWHGGRRFRYDAAGQLVETTDGNGGVTRYDYDVCGRLVAITDPLGAVTRRAHDALGRLTAETDPLGRTTTLAYDRAGRPVAQTDPTGVRTEWSYDDAGREAEQRVDGRVVWTVVSRDLRRRSVVVADSSDPDRPVEHELTWNRRRQLITRRRGDRRLEWSYDTDGHRDTLTGPDGLQTRYRRDAAGRVTAVEHPRLGRATFSYDPAGRLVQAGAGDLIQTWRHTDGFVVEHTTTGPDGATSRRLDRDEWGRISAIGSASGRCAYGYDEACQLIEARLDDGTVSSWRYDRAGRLVAESVAGSQRVHEYDTAGQLTATLAGDDRTDYEYDQAGRRIRAESPDGRVRRFSWSDSGRLTSIADQSETGDLSSVSLSVDAFGELARIDDLDTWWDSAAGFAPGLVQVGTTPVLPTPGGLTGIGDGWATPGWRTGRAVGADPWAADPFRTLDEAGLGIGGAGELRIAGLEWLGARAFDPATRGFLSVDPLDPVPGAGWSGNPYAYAGNDPLHALDPTGLSPVTDEELKAYAASNDGAASAVVDWVGDNWEYLAGGAMVIAGGVLMATGVGGPAGMALLSAGADTIIQKATTGEVNWGQVAISGAIGGVGGGLAGLAAKASKGGLAALRSRVAVYGTVGAMGGEASYVTKNWGNLSWRGALGAGAGGFLGGAVGGASGPGGGTLATLMGKASTSLTAKSMTAGINFVGGASASVTNNIVSGNPINWTGAAIAGGVSGATSYIPPYVSANGTGTLNQLSYFGPRTPAGLVNFGGGNTQALWTTVGQGAATSYAANMGLHFGLGTP